MATTTNTELDTELADRLKALPRVVRDAITSADVAKRMRGLADTHKLHLDQWQKLENEVMLALLGFQPVEDLKKNIQSELVVNEQKAAELSADISKIVFEPIRQELERELEHPEAKEEKVSEVEAARTQVLGTETSSTTPEAPPTPAAAPLVPTVAPATPPASAAPTEPVARPANGAYKPGEASHLRKDVHDDPYRETPTK